MVKTLNATALTSESLFFENRIEPRVLLNAKQMAELLAINENQLYKLVRSGKIPAIKLGRALRFQWEEVMTQVRSPSCPT